MGKNKILNLVLIGGLLMALAFAGGCIPEATPKEGGEFNWAIIIFIVLIFALLYFTRIRPQRKKQKDQQQMTQELKRGDKIITIGGMHGQIESISEDSIVIKVESGALIRMVKNAVAGVKS